MALRGEFLTRNSDTINEHQEVFAEFINDRLVII